MGNHNAMKKHTLCTMTVSVMALSFACGGSTSPGGGGSGGGGAGSGGATGAAAGAGGTSKAGTGGATSSGGQFSSGGSTGSGGTSATGGATNASGGRTGAGGSGSPLGGATSSGGQSGSGGATASGGSSAGGQSGLGGGSDGGGAGTGGAAGAGGTTGVGGAAGNGCPAGTGGNTSVTINNTGPWNDTTGKHIQAHGGGFLKVCDTWYWFGEDKTLNTNGTGNFHAISCYASKDLVTWEHRGQVVTNNTASVLNNTNLIIERPKVIYNASTKLYVMWAHWDMESCSGVSGGYCDSEAIVFTSPTVDGSYTYVNHFKPGGNGSRDCTLWQEPDGTAYFVSPGGTNGAGNFTDTEVYALSSDYLTVKNTTKIWTANGFVEAYAFWKYNGNYYGVCSGQTGWAPNQARYLTSTGSITGPWNTTFSYLGANGSTWNSQPTYVIPIVGSQTTTYIYASDIWNSNNLSLSTYLWLPLTWDGTKWTLTDSAQWSINLETGVVSGN